MADTFNLPRIGDAMPLALPADALIANAAGPLPHRRTAGSGHG